MALVTARSVRPYGQGGIEQQHALLGPPRQVARDWHGCPHVALYLLEYIQERWRHGYTIRNREAEAHGLSLLMVGVLPDDDYAHVVERAEVEGVEDKAPGRVARMLLILGAHELGKVGKVGLVKLAADVAAPRLVYLYIHVVAVTIWLQNYCKSA